MSKKLETKYVVTAEDRTKAALQSMRDGFKKTEDQAGKLRGALDGFKSSLGPLAAALSVVAGANFIKSAMQVADATDEMAASLNTTTEALTRLQFGATLAGVDTEKFGVALRNMNAYVNEAATSAYATTDSLSKLGIVASDLNKMTGDEKFKVLANAISLVKDPAEQAALASEFWGKKIGTKLLPYIKDGIVGINKFEQESDRVGNTLNGTTAVSIANVADSFVALKAQADALARTLLISLGDSILIVNGWIVNIIKTVDSFVKSLGKMDRGTLDSIVMLGAVIVTSIALFKALTSIVGIIGLVTTAWEAMNVAAAAGAVVSWTNPILLAFAAIAAAIVLIVGLYAKWKLGQDSIKPIEVPSDPTGVEQYTRKNADTVQKVDRVNIWGKQPTTRDSDWYKSAEDFSKKMPTSNRTKADILKQAATYLFTPNPPAALPGVKDLEDREKALKAAADATKRFADSVAAEVERLQNAGATVPTNGALGLVVYAESVEKAKAALAGLYSKSADDLRKMSPDQLKAYEEQIKGYQQVLSREEKLVQDSQDKIKLSLEQPNDQIKAAAIALKVPLTYTIIDENGKIVPVDKTGKMLQDDIALKMADELTKAGPALVAMAVKLKVPLQVLDWVQPEDPNVRPVLQKRDKTAAELQPEVLAAKVAADAMTTSVMTFGQAVDTMSTSALGAFTTLGSGITDVLGGAFSGLYEQMFKLSEGPIMIGEAFGRMVASVLGSLTTMIAKLVIAAALTTIISAVFGGGANVGKVIASINSWAGISGKAVGGPTSMGQPYVVGERGPELFVPNSYGRIIPNNKMQGGARQLSVTNHINIDAKGDIFSDKLKMARLAEVINNEIENKVKTTYYQPSAA